MLMRGDDVLDSLSTIGLHRRVSNSHLELNALAFIMCINRRRVRVGNYEQNNKDK